MRIDKTYRPELLNDECYVDARASRLIVVAERAMVVLPVSVARRERSGAVDVAGLRAARTRHPEDPQATLRVTRAPAEDWERKLPKFCRGARRTVTLLVNVSELKRVADALGVVTVALTAQGPQPPFVVQPIDAGAEEVGVLFAERPAPRKACKRQRRKRWNLDGWADEILEGAGDHGLTTRAIG